MRCVIVLAALCCVIFAQAQKKPVTLKPHAAKAIIDTEIASMAQAISPDSVKSYVQKLVSFGTRHSLSDTSSAARGIGAARRWTASKFIQFRDRNKADLEVQLDAYTVEPSARHPGVPRRVTMKNVLAILKGTDTQDSRVLLVSGHLDSRNTDVMDSAGLAPGANDDASGVAVVLELARIMSVRKYPCTIIFMAVQGEEQGLIGARHMAGKLKNSKVNLVAMLNNDIVGNSVASETGEKNNKAVRIFSEMVPAFETDEQTAARNSLKSENDSPSRQLARYIKETGDVYIKEFSSIVNARPDRFLRAGDHTPFNQLGFTAVRFTEFNEDFTHQHQNVRKENDIQYGDLPEFVDYDYAANVARLNLVTLASLAKAPGQPRRVKMKMDLTNVTNLTWEAPETGPKVKGYFVLTRETIQPFWERKFFIEGTSVALPFSKDNYFFALQSVGQEGHTSTAVIPLPER